MGRLALVLFLWGAVLVIANPYLKDRLLRVIALSCLISASIAFVLNGVVP